MGNSTDSHAREQAKAQLASIREMVAALTCDYDRLEELRDERAAIVEDDKEAAPDELRLPAWDEEFAEELTSLENDAGECNDRDDASQRIDEDPLSVEVRSDWHSVGDDAEDAEFCILLCTGGPAVRIIGELNNSEPSSARLQFQDWGTGWEELILDSAERDDVLTYCRHFCFEH